jgi:hypothetical protein
MAMIRCSPCILHLSDRVLRSHFIVSEPELVKFVEFDMKVSIFNSFMKFTNFDKQRGIILIRCRTTATYPAIQFYT